MSPIPPSGPARLALALLALDGVGRVTASRLLDRFPTAEALRATPREQVLLRLKGAPKADRTVDLLFSDALDRALDEAAAETGRLAATGVRALAPGDADWPSGLNALPRAERPVVLYAYGDAAALARPLLAVLARPPVPGDAFEAAQRVVRAIVAAGGGVAVGAAHGFDLALQKVALGAGRAPVAILGGGLATLAPSLRPAATQLVRAGGLLVSPFPMAHGPFPHDDRERALVQAALARAVLVAAPAEGSPESRAAAWAVGAERPVALVGESAEEWAAGVLRADDAAADPTVTGWLAQGPT